MKTLVELFKEGGSSTYPTDKGAVHSYLPYYDKIFAPFRDKDINIFEVGFLNGGSCKLWQDYFTKAKIKAIDITWKWRDEYSADIDPKRVSLEIKDAKTLNGDYLKEINPTIVIDDGSHLIEDQILFVKTVYPYVQYGGYLIVEDLHAIDEHKKLFEQIGYPFEIIDFRPISGRWDDVLIVYKK